ncbi:MAG TPA: YihY/virulence factor BrkB family protein, partial [Armatimonadota bacterium]|nr:YihY/virulence factor BrkB family protein [Armatimonadota bacterium]
KRPVYLSLRRRTTTGEEIVRLHLGQSWHWIRAVYREFREEHASLTAAAIALFGLLSLFPFLLLALSGVSYGLGNPEQALQQIDHVLGLVLVGDARTSLINMIEGVLRTRRIAGVLGLFGFLWAASRVFTIMAESFNMAWDVEETRGFIHRNLLAIAMVLVAFVFGIIIFVAPLAVGLLLRHSGSIARWLGVPFTLPATLPLLTDLIAYAATIGLFFLFYKTIPNRRIHWQSALAGAVTAGTIWVIFKYLFQLYLVNFSRYNQVYGALAGFIVLILWLYYSAIILQLGTITAVVYSAHHFSGEPPCPAEDEEPR